MRHAVPALIILTVACAAIQPAAQSTTTSCKLPVSIADATGHAQGAFVSYPGGKLTIDHAGDGGAYYDSAHSRWLPATRSAVSADGLRYAYVEPKAPVPSSGESLHIVDVASGRQKVYELGPTSSPSGYLIVEFGTEGIWLTNGGYEAPGGGLLVLDAASATLKDMSGGKDLTEPMAGGPGVFWFTDPGPNPQIAAIGFPIPARVLRLTIADGKTELWVAKPGKYVRIFGSDPAGHLIFGTFSDKADGYDLWIASAPSEDKLIGLPVGVYAPFADRHGIWFGGAKGIYLYTPAGKLQQVSSLNASPAGACT